MDISSPKCLIIDDTLLCKTGKTIEHTGKVFDHCSQTYQLGMKALICGLWDEIKNRNKDMKNKQLANQFY